VIPGRPPRIALCGNIAQNAYLLCKFLRRLGVEADSFDLGGGNPMWLPWWEEADLDPSHLHPSHYDWLSIAAETGFRRPPWAKILGVLEDAPWYDTQEAYQADLSRLIAGAVHGQLGRSQRASDAAAAAALARSRLSPAEQAACVRPLREQAYWPSLLALARAYDLLVLFGPFAAAAVVLPKTTPYVTFEHSTMRLVPLLDTPDRVLLAAAYGYAGHNVLTNADCREAAWCLGLAPERLSFIPHPVDTDFFCPDPQAGTTGEDEEVRGVREHLRAGIPGGAKAIFFAPARQCPGAAPTGGKRNDRAYYAFKRYLEEAEPAGAPPAVLVAGSWGDGPDVGKGAALVQALGIAHRVVWLRAQPKRRMRALYRACDVVLDQFDGACGSFGTVTAEALATGTPVITHVDPAAHAWCRDRLSLPPVCQALTAPEIYAHLVALAGRPARRERHGAAGRAWIEQEHSWRHVAEDHLAVYGRVLGVPREAFTTPAAPAADTAGPQIHWTDAGPVAVGAGSIAAAEAAVERSIAAAVEAAG
jgi:glycosyltransferase involved in cell wall biosynthesis